MIFLSVLGFSFCYFLISLGMNPILSSAIVGLLGSLIPQRWSRDASAIIYSASFAAIGAASFHKSFIILMLIPICIWGIYYYSKSHFQGLGGKLGTIAFISTGVFVLIARFL